MAIKSYVHASDKANVIAEGDRRVIAGRLRNDALRRAGELTLEDSFQQVIIIYLWGKVALNSGQ